MCLRVALSGVLPASILSGTGVHYFSTQIVHQETPTESGMTQRSSDIVRLETGETTGSVHFGRSADAGGDTLWFDCELTVTGTGTTPDGDAEVAYQGTCRPGTSP